MSAAFRGLTVRILAATLAGLASALVGLSVSGTFDPAQADRSGLFRGADTLMLDLAVGLLAAVLVYGAVELAQTGRVDSLARQFDTRTIVLMPVAIAIDIVLGQTVGSALRIPVYLDSIGTILVGVLCGPLPGALTGLLANLTWTFLLSGTIFGSPYAWPFGIVAAEIGLLAGLFGRFGFFRVRRDVALPTFLGGLAVAAVVLGGLAWWGVLPFYRGLPAFTLFADPTSVDPVFRVVGLGIAVLLVIAAATLVLRLVRLRDLGVPIVVVAGATCGVVSALVAAPIAAYVFGGVTGSGTDFLVAAFQQAGSDLRTAVVQQSLISDPIDKTMTFLIVYAVLGSLSRRIVARFPQGELALGLLED